MMENGQFQFEYPGSRWWKFDFHTHTPASLDTTSWQKAKGTPEEVTPEIWLLKYMSAEIDCVAVTDHNTGEWIDRLQEVYSRMKQKNDSGILHDGFRELTIFPGVEISVNGNFHLLALFDPRTDSKTINDLLASIRYDGTNGSGEGTTLDSPYDVINKIDEVGGIAIPAHADRSHGLLQLDEKTQKFTLDPKMIERIMKNEIILAFEWIGNLKNVPEIVERYSKRKAIVSGSDSHNFYGNNIPGSRFSWIKMGTPTLEGLRLALVDGEDISVCRSFEKKCNPSRIPARFIRSIEIENAKYMGNGIKERLEFSPYCNTLIGGRGSGKSTIVHAFRLAFKREGDLDLLGDTSEPCIQFHRFVKSADHRYGDGAMKSSSVICVELMRDGIPHQLEWRCDPHDIMVNEKTTSNNWIHSSSQCISSERFPIRILSQGQLSVLAGEGRKGLMDIIDEAAAVGELSKDLEEKKRIYFTKRSRLREIDIQIESRQETERRLIDVKRKLDSLEKHHDPVLIKQNKKMLRQQVELNRTFHQMSDMRKQIESLSQKLLLDDWPSGVFEQELNAEKWKNKANMIVAEMKRSLLSLANSLAEKEQALRDDGFIKYWNIAFEEISSNYHKMQSSLPVDAKSNSIEMNQLNQERQQLEKDLEKINQLEADREFLLSEIENQWKQVHDARESITRARQSFCTRTLENNDYVRIQVVPFGFDATRLEHDLRELLDCLDDRFESDILINSDSPSGMVFDLSDGNIEARKCTLDAIKKKIIDIDYSFGGHFRNYLERLHKKPEFTDHVHCWFPEDDLRIEYSQSTDRRNWLPINQGSQGQRSAALLAFILSFGDEPLIIDQPEDDLDNSLIYNLIVNQIRNNKLRRQLIIVTHNPNIVVNGDAEMIHALKFHKGQCRVQVSGALQDISVRKIVCEIMEGGLRAFSLRWKRLGGHLSNEDFSK